MPLPTTTDASNAASVRLGLALGAASYAWWGTGPLYFKLIANAGVPAPVTLCHRIVWSVVVLLMLIAVRRSWREVGLVARNGRVCLMLAVSTVCIATNWLVYIYSVEVGRVVESSLGYFINPLFTVMLGMVFLGERLRTTQWIAVAIAAAGVIYLTIARGGLPWIAIVLPVSFGFYSLIRKRTPVGPVAGLFIETAMLAPFALGWMLWSHSRPESAAFTTPPTLALLSLAGIMTTVPLLLFVAAAQRLPLVTMGFLQYINPTIQFLTAVLLFGEPFGRDRVIAFTLIWVALAIFIADILRRSRSSRLARAVAEAQDARGMKIEPDAG